MMSLLSCIQIQPILNQVATIGLDMKPSDKKLEGKVVIVLGATGTGKSKLSISLAEKYSGEIINSDKMQIHEGLDIVTNKVTKEETNDIPHHLLSVIGPNADFMKTDFCRFAPLSMQSIMGKGKLPIIAGGSNSFIEALVDAHNHDHKFQPRCDFCFLWVDVSIPILNHVLSKRVDQMLERGLVDEVREMFDPYVDYSKGVWRAIGLPELDHYFRLEKSLDKESRARILEEAINEMKLNTHKLAFRQKEKIKRLRNEKKWKIHQLDATEVYKSQGKKAAEAWRNFVMDPSIKIVDAFLNKNEA